MTACLDDELKIALPDNYDFDEGDLVEVSLGLNVDEFTVTSGSRAYSEEATDTEKKIDNVWVFQFDTDGNCLIKPRYYTITNQSQLTDLPILLKADVASTIYVVANTNSDTWANATNRSKFNTITALESMDNPNNLAQEGNNLSLPMCGMITNTIVTGNENVVIPVKRTVAKLKIRVDITKDTENWEYKNINVQNIPNVNRVASRKIDNGTTPAVDGSVSSKMYNTGLQSRTGSRVVLPSDVVGDFSFADYSKHFAHNNSSSDNIKGFYIEVKQNGTSNEQIAAPDPGSAPKMFLIPDIGYNISQNSNACGWLWPSEGVNIKGAYQFFDDWTENSALNPNWYTEEKDPTRGDVYNRGY